MKFWNSLHRFFSNQEERHFWLGHIFTVVATVVGVYLAAQSGFRKAIEFELLKSDRDEYYVSVAFLSELTDNINMVEDLIVRMEKNGNYSVEEEFTHGFRNFVWKAMRFNSETLQLPTPALNQAAQFYSKATLLLKNMHQRGNGWDSPKDQYEKLKLQVEKVKSVALPAIKNHIKKVKENLLKENINP